MPLYEYLCSDCDSKFEVLRSFSQADQPASCVHCQSPDTKRAISLFAAFSKSGDGGESGRSLGGDGCASCAATSCATCQS
jgi:putative FmdB family regulatory protein